ncbi:MAG: hypothetical protein ACREVY_10350 [Gammaproteobacteria bacterium]
MNDIKGIHYSEAEFDKNGKLESRPSVPAGTTDLIVVSHGWNNDRDEAEKLYTKLFGNFVAATKDDPAIAERKLAIVGVIWPAKKFDALMTQTTGSGAPAAGAASIGPANAAAAQAAIRAAIDRVAPLFEEAEEKKNLERLRELVPTLENDPDSQKKFVEILRRLLDPKNQYADQRHSEDSSDVLFEGNPQNIFDNAKQSAPASATEPATPAPKDAGATDDPTGHAAGFLDVASATANAVSNLLNVTTYFEMKKRAGTVGKNGVGPLIDKLASDVKSIERIHLVGHSFGARVVTAAADSSTTPKLHSLSLLQGAFSHNGFSRSKSGFFRSIVENKRVAGPILITHTKNDRAVGLAYPAASRISGDSAAGFGDADDDFGAIGSNGAQQMDSGEIFDGADTLLALGSKYPFQAGKFHNLKSDGFIVDPQGGDAHGMVFVPEVAWAISRAVVS